MPQSPEPKDSEARRLWGLKGPVLFAHPPATSLCRQLPAPGGWAATPGGLRGHTEFIQRAQDQGQVGRRDVLSAPHQSCIHSGRTGLGSRKEGGLGGVGSVLVCPWCVSRVSVKAYCVCALTCACVCVCVRENLYVRVCTLWCACVSAVNILVSDVSEGRCGGRSVPCEFGRVWHSVRCVMCTCICVSYGVCVCCASR